MKRMAMVLACAAMVTGCDNGIEKALRADMKDPESAQFKDQVEYKKWACISVNSKNSYGGYTGFKRYLLKKSSSGYSIEGEMGECTLATMVSEEISEQEAEKVEGRVLALLKEKKLIPANTATTDSITDALCSRAASDAATNGRLAITWRPANMRRRFEETRDSLMDEFRQGKCGSLKATP